MEDEVVYPLQCHSYLTRGLVHLLSSPRAPPHVQRNALLVLERLPLEYHFPNTIVCIDRLMRALQPFMKEKNPNAPSATAAMKRLRKNAEIRHHRLRAAEGCLLDALLNDAEGKEGMPSAPAAHAVAGNADKASPSHPMEKEKARLPSKTFSVELLQEWLAHTRRREAFVLQQLGLPDPSSSHEQEEEEESLERDALKDVAEDEEMAILDGENKEEPVHSNEEEEEQEGEEEETGKTGGTEEEGSRAFASRNEEEENEENENALEEEEEVAVLSCISSSSSSSSSSFSSVRDEENACPTSSTEHDSNASSEERENEESAKEGGEHHALRVTPL